jgi:hypothetical protein
MSSVPVIDQTKNQTLAGRLGTNPQSTMAVLAGLCCARAVHWDGTTAHALTHVASPSVEEATAIAESAQLAQMQAALEACKRSSVESSAEERRRTGGAQP